MQDNLLPLFPLQLVLLPNTPLPLHIFEDRYKEMIGDIRKDNREFGVVQAGERGIMNTGCTATIERILKEYPDGRMDILAFGRRRFEIFELNDEKSYLKGEVNFFDDDEEKAAPMEMQQKAIASFQALKAADDTVVYGDPQVGDERLSFQVAQLISDLQFRQILLNTRSETERLRQFVQFTPRYVDKLRLTAHVKQVAPRNGHSKHDH